MGIILLIDKSALGQSSEQPNSGLNSAPVRWFHSKPESGLGRGGYRSRVAS
jgi:hypothetical protein